MDFDPIKAMWKVDRKAGRMVYATREGTTGTNDLLIGMMDTEEIAAGVVESHNLLLRRSDLAETAAELEARAELYAFTIKRLQTADAFVDWLLEMDDPLNIPGQARRQRITLAWIFEEARSVRGTRDDQIKLN